MTFTIHAGDLHSIDLACFAPRVLVSLARESGGCVHWPVEDKRLSFLARTRADQVSVAEVIRIVRSCLSRGRRLYFDRLLRAAA